MNDVGHIPRRDAGGVQEISYTRFDRLVRLTRRREDLSAHCTPRRGRDGNVPEQVPLMASRSLWS